MQHLMDAAVKPSRQKLVYLLMAMTLVMVAGNAFGFTYGAGNPGTTDLMYDLFNFTSNAVTGAPAYAFGMIGVCVGGYMLWKQQIVPAIGVFACLICVIRCNTILTSLGYTFS
jgi:hypothetical protein